MVRFTNVVQAIRKLIFNYKRDFGLVLRFPFFVFMVTPKIIDREKCIKYFKYKDGKLYYQINRQKKFIGKRAGQKHNSRDYWVVYMNQVPYLEHRIIYTILIGDIPSGMEIDHKDNNGLNNSIDNLRIATRSQNNTNRGKLKTNTSGFKGVTFIKSKNRWKAQLSIGKINKSFGLFKTPQQAYEAYKIGFVKIRGIEFWNEG